MAGKKILCVDDASSIRQLVSLTLSRSGFEVVEAASADEGLAKLTANPDVVMVISDVNMPGKTGIEFLEDVRKNPAWEKLPFALLTTESSADVIARAKAAGARAWMNKPFEPAQLLKVVEKLTAAAA